jgi:hypothetical protein
VYHCCGVNMVALLCDAHRVRGAGLEHDLWPHGTLGPVSCEPQRGVVYQHVAVEAGRVEVVGEHALAGARPLRRAPGFFGATRALTDHVPGAETWVATLVVEDVDAGAVRLRADAVVDEIARHLRMPRVAGRARG